MNNEKLQRLMNDCRVGKGDDQYLDGFKINRLYGLQTLIENNLSKNSVVCEIGSYRGVSSELFALYCKQVYCVDIFSEPKIEIEFDEMMRNYNNIIKIKKYSIEAVKDFPDNLFDFVYIDASHDYSNVKQDIMVWKNKVRKGGFLGGHDYHLACPGVRHAVNDYFEDKICIYKDSSWLVKL